MISVFRDEILTHPAGANFTLRLHGEIKFYPGKVGQFSPGICLGLLTFSVNVPLLACVKLLFHPT